VVTKEESSGLLAGSFVEEGTLPGRSRRCAERLGPSSLHRHRSSRGYQFTAKCRMAFRRTALRAGPKTFCAAHPQRTQVVIEESFPAPALARIPLMIEYPAA